MSNRRLRHPILTVVAALVVVIAALAQAVLAGLFMSQEADGAGLREVHGVVGMATVLITAIAALLAWLGSRRGPSLLPFWIGLGLTVLSVVQVGLGEMGAEGIHMSFGVLFLAGAVWMLVVSIGIKRGVEDA